MLLHFIDKLYLWLNSQYPRVQRIEWKNYNMEKTSLKSLNCRGLITAIIYITLLLDNILLTVIGEFLVFYLNFGFFIGFFLVPILPDFLQSFNNKTSASIPPSTLIKNFDLHYIPNSMMNKHPTAGNSIKNITTKDNLVNLPNFDVEKENGNVGILLAVKAFVQLFFNPIAGNLSGKFGYKSIIFFGTINLLFSSLSEFKKMFFFFFC